MTNTELQAMTEKELRNIIHGIRKETDKLIKGKKSPPKSKGNSKIKKPKNGSKNGKKSPDCNAQKKSSVLKKGEKTDPKEQETKSNDETRSTARTPNRGPLERFMTGRQSTSRKRTSSSPAGSPKNKDSRLK